MEKTFLIDLTKCTACRGCQVACKQWHKLPAEKTKNRGSHQNPADLSFITYKLVRFQEQVIDRRLQWLFFPEQCRHCITAPCKEVADGYLEGAILRDESTQAVIFTEKTARLSKDEREEVRENCPYDIPREDPATGVMSKCDMCVDRVHNGMLPACVKSCPTGTMRFGNREDMLTLAGVALGRARKTFKNAVLVDAKEVNAIFLAAFDPKLYFNRLMADGDRTRMYTRKQMLAKVFKPLRAGASG